MSDRLEVTQPSDNRTLVLLADVKTEMQITGSADDAFLGTLISQATAAIESYCGRTFARQEYRQTIRLDSTRDSLILRSYPIASIDSVVEDGDTLSGSTDYETDLGAGLLFRISSDRKTTWPKAVKIVVEYTAGYIMPGDTGEDLPADVTRVATELVKTAYKSRARDGSIARESVPEVYDVSFARFDGTAQSIPPNLAAMLDPYRSQVY